MAKPTLRLQTPLMVSGRLFLALLCGCPKPAPSHPSGATVPASITPPDAQGNGLTVQGKIAAVEEWNRDDPDYIAIRKLYNRSKSATKQGDYRQLFALVPPSERISQLCQAIAAARAELQRWDTKEGESRLPQILRSHRLPTEPLPDPGSRLPAEEQVEAAWELVEDMPGCFDEVVKSNFEHWFFWPPLSDYYEGEIRVESISGREALARVVGYDPKPGENLVVHFIKEGSEWHMRIPLEVLK